MTDNLNKNDDLMPDTFEEREELERKRYKLAKKQDIFVILGILLLAVGLWVYAQLQGRGQTLVAEVFYMNEIIDTIELKTGQEESFTYPQNPEVVIRRMADASIRFERSDCPDQICVNAGTVHTHDAFIACVPNGFLISIQAVDDGHNNEEVDIVN